MTTKPAQALPRFRDAMQFREWADEGQIEMAAAALRTASHGSGCELALALDAAMAAGFSVLFCDGVITVDLVL